MKIRNRVILVTGGSGLIGKEIIRTLEKHGAIAINLDLNESLNECEYFFKVDITNQSLLKTSLRTISSKFGQLDGLVNNAYPRSEDYGVSFLEDKNLKSWRENIDLHMNSYAACCQEILPYMMSSESGSIVNMASIYGIVGNDLTLYENTNIPTVAPYSAIKGGLINFTRYLASCYGSFSIRVNCVSPGGLFDKQDRVFVENYIRRVPLGRMAYPSDIAGPVCFLLSTESSYITGQNIIVDGGYTSI